MNLLNERYQIIEKIGQGAESEVFICYDIKLKLNWAIKRIPKSKFNINECYREVNILKDLRHSGLPIIVDVFEDSEFVYVVRDYIKGMTLKQFVEKNGPLSFYELKIFMETVIDILDYLHNRENPIIYRDLKPENIIRNEKGDYFLIDFGITRTYKKYSDSDTIYMGTKGYAAPELYCSLQSDPRTDIYAFGATVYYAFTGVLFNEVDEHRKWKRSVSENELLIRTIVEKSTEFDPQNRYQSVLEIFSELNRENDLNIGIRNSKKYIGKISIGLMGYKSGVGTTHIAFLLAKCLENENFRVNLIDYSRNSGLSTYENFLEGEEISNISKNKEFQIGRIRGFKSNFPFVDALRRECDYQIIDFGSDHFNMNEFLKLQYKFFILPASAWSYDKNYNAILEEIKDSEDISFIVNMSCEKNYTKLCKWLKLDPKRVYKVPFSDIYHISEVSEYILTDILNYFNDVQSDKKNFKFKFFGRKK